MDKIEQYFFAFALFLFSVFGVIWLIFIARILLP